MASVHLLVKMTWVQIFESYRNLFFVLYPVAVVAVLSWRVEWQVGPPLVFLL